MRNGGLDANGQVPDRTKSDGDGNPCRHCQQDIEAGKEMLVLSHRPFASLQPYAEQGPIFLCAEACSRFKAESRLPETVLTRPEFLLRGYDKQERIVGGTGKIVPTRSIENYVAMLMEDPNIAAVHVRSSSNNCYFGKIKRAE
jgi:hypothetical protein